MSRHFQDWIEAYLSLVKGKSEAPTVYHKWSAVSTIAAAITRHVCINEVSFKFYPNMFVVLAARPGVAKKTTTVDLCMRLLRDIEPSLFGPDETNWPDLCQTFAAHTQMKPKDLSITDPLEIEYEVQCALTLCLGEFGTFLKPADTDMVNGLTSLWDSRDVTYIKSTKFSGVDHVQNAFINIIGCSTAQWLRDNFRAFAGWGIAGRILFVHSDRKATPIYRPSKLIDVEEWNTYREQLKDDLKVIRELQGECQLTLEADKTAEEWYIRISEECDVYSRRIDADQWVVDFLGRKQAHVHKLAIVLSVSRRDSLVITEEDFLDAVSYIDGIELELRRVFGAKLTPSEAAMNERALWDSVYAELSNGLAGRAPKTHIFNRLATYVDGANAERILSSFVRRGLLREEATSSGMTVRLPDGEIHYNGKEHYNEKVHD